MIVKPAMSLLFFVLVSTVFSSVLCTATTPPGQGKKAVTSGDASQHSEAGSQSEAGSVTPTDTADQACSHGRCFSVNYDDIWRFYGGLFLSESEITSREISWIERHRAGRTMKRSTSAIFNRIRQKRHAQSQCCQSFLRHKVDTQLIDIQGESRDILHLSHLHTPRYQWYPHVQCVAYNTKSCVTKNITKPLLVYSKSGWPSPFEFAHFRFPAYCSCAVP